MFMQLQKIYGSLALFEPRLITSLLGMPGNLVYQPSWERVRNGREYASQGAADRTFRFPCDVRRAVCHRFVLYETS